MRGATHRIPGLAVTEHRFRVPLDHRAGGGPELEVFAREVAAADAADRDLPWLVFFQGGPGGESPRPMGRSGWVGRAVDDYRVLLLDQRGTGLSTPVTAQTLARFDSPSEQADYLRHFRADSIVADAELIRRELLGERGKWSILGQSFGGFCSTRYLSVAPEGLSEVFITGGLPSLDAECEDVYRRTYPIVAAKNRRYYERYPGDVERVQEIVAFLAENDVRTEDDGRLSVRRFQQLGLLLGFSDGFELLHYLFERAFVAGRGGKEMSDLFVRGVESAVSFSTMPIFSVLHEACYAQRSATRWAAERVRSEFPEFEPSAGEPVFLTGEMIYPWMFAEYPALRPFAEAAELLAQEDAWPPLYDRDVLAANDVPCAAAIYYDDMYVPRDLSEATAGAIRGLRPWVTNEHEHNGLRSDGERVLGHLIGLVRGDA